MNINMDLNILSTYDSEDYQNKQYTCHKNMDDAEKDIELRHAYE